MKKITSDIVGKLWNLCNILKDDGVTYHQYVTELTYLLFLKMASEIEAEDQLPNGFRWSDLIRKANYDPLEFYKILLVHLGMHGSPTIRKIFENASSFIKKSSTLSVLLLEIDKLEWYSMHREDLGDLYEGLLERNANEKKSGAGQYFTPRALIDSMVAVTKPTLDDEIQDPAAGTGGFLIAANHYLREKNDISKLRGRRLNKYRTGTFFGMEHVQDTHRLAMMNLVLHGIEGGIEYGDTLGAEGTVLRKRGATLILTNPPFGTKKGGGRPSRDDLPYSTSNKQLSFLQHIYLSLIKNGRAAVILPDNVLFEGNLAADIRRDLMNKCNLHTILRLPVGIFYAQGVKTSVLFFTRGINDQDNTGDVWFYDLRTNMSQFGRRTQLSRDHFAEFEKFYGNDPYGDPKSLAERSKLTETGRFKRFSRDQIAARGDNLDITWSEENINEANFSEADPVVLAQDIMVELMAAVNQIETLLEEFGEDTSQ